jgi:hypothetical protein
MTNENATTGSGIWIRRGFLGRFWRGEEAATTDRDVAGGRGGCEGGEERKGDPYWGIRRIENGGGRQVGAGLGERGIYDVTGTNGGGGSFRVTQGRRGEERRRKW